MSKIVTRTRPEVFEIWINTLLSGKYKQAKGTLRKVVNDGRRNRVKGFCCVGVLCDLANKDRGERWKFEDFEYVNMPILYTETKLSADGIEDWLTADASEMPVTMRRYLGLTEDEVANLYQMNDGEDEAAKTFEQIAAHIRDVLMPRALKRPMPFVE